MFQAIKLKQQGPVWFLNLNRPEKRNAMDDVMMDEIIQVLLDAERDGVRVLVISGSGSAFCAGADLNWMRKMKDYTLEENERDSARLARLYRALRTARPVTMTVVNGPAIGGAVGIVAASDIALAVKDASFSFGEVRLGIIPAVIGPYIVEKTGVSVSRYYMLTGERFGAARAKEIGLVHKVYESVDALEAGRDEVVRELLSGGVTSQRKIKHLMDHIVAPPTPELEELTVKLIASARVSKEGQEGIRAFFEKRRPSWSEDYNGDN
ncbi:MAG: enoyl-CoA hydratase/isomerase family protein [Acidobacteria bacterium]|nr:MAG: enoyl-CoA hydratase/isomerase family protein [Acidobacteriota bacterium]